MQHHLRVDVLERQAELYEPVYHLLLLHVRALGLEVLIQVPRLAVVRDDAQVVLVLRAVETRRGYTKGGSVRQVDSMERSRDVLGSAFGAARAPTFAREFRTK